MGLLSQDGLDINDLVVEVEKGWLMEADSLSFCNGICFFCIPDVFLILAWQRRI